VLNRGHQFLYEYNQKIRQGEPVEILKETNSKIAAMEKEESDKALSQILKQAFEHMKIRYHRGDN
jgi:dipeptidase